MEKVVFVLRKAVEGDISGIQEITREAFKMYMENAGLTGTISALEESYEDIKRDIKTKEVFVAVLNGVIIGSVRVELRADKTAYLSRFGVGLAYQNMGFLLMISTGNPVLLLLGFLFTGLSRGSISNFNNTVVNEVSNSSPAALNFLHSIFAVGALIAPFLVILCTRVFGDTGWRVSAGIIVALGVVCIYLFSKMKIHEIKTLLIFFSLNKVVICQQSNRL